MYSFFPFRGFDVAPASPFIIGVLPTSCRQLGEIQLCYYLDQARTYPSYPITALHCRKVTAHHLFDCSSSACVMFCSPASCRFRPSCSAARLLFKLARIEIYRVPRTDVSNTGTYRELSLELICSTLACIENCVCLIIMRRESFKCRCRFGLQPGQLSERSGSTRESRSSHSRFSGVLSFLLLNFALSPQTIRDHLSAHGFYTFFLQGETPPRGFLYTSFNR